MLLPVSEIHMLLQQTEIMVVLSEHSPESIEEYCELGRKCIVSRPRVQPAETGYHCVSLPTGMGMSHLINQPREEKSLLVSDVSCKVSIRNIWLVTRRNVAMVIYSTDRTDVGEGRWSKEEAPRHSFRIYERLAGTNLSCKQPRPIIYHFINQEKHTLLFKPELNMAQPCKLLWRMQWKSKGNGY